MRHPRTMSGALALTTALVAGPALADVTAADVFANQQAYLGALGMTFSGTLDGDTLRSPKITAALPMGAGGFEITAPDITMTENGDGTVTLSYPGQMSVGFAGFVQEAGSASATLDITHDGYTVIASGNPGDVTYESSVNNLRASLGDWTATDVPSDAVDVTVDVSIDEWQSTSRVVEGNLVTVTSETQLGTTQANVAISTPDGVNAVTEQTNLPTVSSVQMTLPTGGSNLLNLSQALRDGLSITLSSAGEGNSSASVTTMQGQIMSSDESSIGAQEFTLRFDADGLALDASAQDFAMTTVEPMLFPGGVSVGVAQIAADWLVPVNAGSAAQPFRIGMALEGLTLGDELWAMFDPEGQLPRDPAVIAFDVSGEGVLGFDLLDFMAMANMFGPPPVTVDSVMIERAEVAAVGARATAEGALTLDWTDMMTWGGIPAPDGNVTVNVEGANGLMDKLVAMGLLQPEDTMGARMMMGMFGEPVGDDALRAVIEVTRGGSLFVNGQQLQ